MSQGKHAVAHKARRISSLRKIVSCDFGPALRLPEISTKKAPDAKPGAFL
jgi:hypothetical protein